VANQYLRKTRLHVEGRDDLYVIADLVKASGFQLDKEPRDVQIDDAAKGDEGHGRDKLLALIKTAVKASTGNAIAFVVDADNSASSTWDAIRHRIEEAIKEAGGSPKLPKTFPTDGFVIDIGELKSRVGVWIMPDNKNPGILEDFLKELVNRADKLIPHAVSATDEAIKSGASFSNEAKPKAIIHAWLAWQAKPGCPFGIAIKSHYFDVKAPSANEFVAWVRRLVD
jgi:hypothetical protein